MAKLRYILIVCPVLSITLTVCITATLQPISTSLSPTAWRRTTLSTIRSESVAAPPTVVPITNVVPKAPLTTLPTNSTLPTSQATVIKPTPLLKEIGETLEMATLDVTIHGIQQLAQPSEVNKSISVDLTVENTAGTVIDLFLCRIHVRDSDGMYYIGDFMPPEFESGTGLQAHKRIRGRVLFQVPTMATGLWLEIFGVQPDGRGGPYFTVAIP